MTKSRFLSPTAPRRILVQASLLPEHDVKGVRVERDGGDFQGSESDPNIAPRGIGDPGGFFPRGEIREW